MQASNQTNIFWRHGKYWHSYPCWNCNNPGEGCAMCGFSGVLDAEVKPHEPVEGTLIINTKQS